MDSRQVSSDENYDAHECLQLQLLTLLNELDHTKQRESALRSATEQWQDTFDAIADAICVLDIENRIIRVNRAMCDLMGMTETAIIGRYCWDVVHGTGFPIAECPCMAVSSEAVRKNLVLQRGQRWYNVTVDPRFDTAGTLQGYIHVMSDISTVKLLEQEQLQTEARMRQAQKMEAIGTLAGGIAHDFNNILTAILGYSEMALDDAEQGQATPAYIRQILRAGERARDLVRQILTFSRQNEAGAKPIQIQPIVKEARLPAVNDRHRLDDRNRCRRAGGPDPDPSSDHEPVHQCGSCHAAWRRTASCKPRGRRPARRACRTSSRAEPGPISQNTGQRHGARHRPRDHRTHFRPLFYHQATRGKHRHGAGFGSGHRR